MKATFWILAGLFMQADYNPVRAQRQTRRCAIGDRPRADQVLEANFIATHAYQILLARKSAGAEDDACYFASGKTDAELESLVKHQSEFLKTDASAVKAWTKGKKSAFDPAKNLEPILCSGVTVPEDAPVNVYLAEMARRSGAERAALLAVASLHQTVLEIDRDGELLQRQFAFYAALGLPVYLKNFRVAGDDETFLEIGRALAAKTCRSPFKTAAADWQIAGRKIWNWAEKHLGIRDARVLAREMLKERDVRELTPKIKAVPAQKIAVIGHSFTMAQHWSSPSSFVPIVTEIFREVNPRVEFRQFERGGLTASRARQMFFQSALDEKPDKVLLVVILRSEQDFAALEELGEGFRAAGVKVYMFDRLNDPANLSGETAARNSEIARRAGIEVIRVGDSLDAAPESGRFLSLDGIHMTEPYHRLMAKEWLKFLVGARE
ncbi:MAG TPA: SGNH/GDSL hydrolase family protein [Pyrinomonadaceae bacterium]